MDKSEAEALCQQHLPRLKNMLSPLRAWSVKLEFRSLDGEAAGECVFDYAYQKATFVFDPEVIKDESDLVRHLRHELFHLLLAPVESHREVILPMIDEAFQHVEAASSRVFIERCVLMLEQVFDWGEGMPPLMPDEDPSETTATDSISSPEKMPA